jgi:hypothetical protein
MQSDCMPNSTFIRRSLSGPAGKACCTLYSCTYSHTPICVASRLQPQSPDDIHSVVACDDVNRAACHVSTIPLAAAAVTAARRFAELGRRLQESKRSPACSVHFGCRPAFGCRLAGRQPKFCKGNDDLMMPIALSHGTHTQHMDGVMMVEGLARRVARWDIADRSRTIPACLWCRACI